jgi:hypothetical protein
MFMLKQIYEAVNRRHFETVLNIPVLTQGIRSDIPVLIIQSDSYSSSSSVERPLSSD